MEISSVELIEFQNPRGQRLHLTNISWHQSKEALVILLEEKVSVHGLVHAIIAQKVEGEDSYWYAYVDMYSEKAVEKAYLYLKGTLLINSKICKLKKVKGRKYTTDLPLAKEKCERLANYYLGFNGWTSELLYHRREVSEGCSTQNTGIRTEKYAAAVKLTARYAEGRSVEGVGIGLADWPIEFPEKKAHARSYAAKQSRSLAVQNAFSKLMLVVVDEGEKVTVEIDLDKVDPFIYNPIWDVPITKVNEVTYDENLDDLSDNELTRVEEM